MNNNILIIVKVNCQYPVANINPKHLHCKLKISCYYNFTHSEPSKLSVAFDSSLCSNTYTSVKVKMIYSERHRAN